MFDITASIVLYKNDESVLMAINSFLAGGSLEKIKLFLIDNSPTDKLRNLINHPSIEYVFNNSNMGFGAGHNVALCKILDNSKYHLVLNPDVIFERNVLSEIFTFMENNPDVGHLMPKIYYPNGEIQYVCKLLPTPFDLIFRRFLPSRFFKSRLDKFQLKFSGYDKLMNIPYLSGCFMFLRTSALKEIGLFDERFFMYPEDIDLTRRMYKRYKTIFYPNVFIIHEHGKGSYANYRLLKIHIVNMIRYFNKWGWFFDAERKSINMRVVKEVNNITR